VPRAALIRLRISAPLDSGALAISHYRIVGP
jgi:hypothetical protein